MKHIGWVLVAAMGCDDGAGAGDGGLAGACVQGDLAAQCPRGSDPIVGARAEDDCASAAGGVVIDGQGQATAQCVGTQGCRVLCRFADPCRCGVASISRDGVVCAECEGAAACGNGACEGGESPESCPVDCGPVCEADERRCDGVMLQSCSLQGRWDDLPCPANEVCVTDPAGAHCERDIVVVDRDAGPGEDAGAQPEGRIIPGDGTWPEQRSAVRGQSPARFVQQTLDDLEPSNGYGALIGAIGGAAIRPSDDGQHLEVFGARGFGRVRLDGSAIIPDRPFDLDQAGFCADWNVCFPAQPVEDCAAHVAAQREQWGDARLLCIAEVIPEQCWVIAGGGPCQNISDAMLRYPGGTDFGVHPWVRGGERLLGPDADLTFGIAVDLTADRRFEHAPIDGQQIVAGRYALSHDGRIAALILRQLRDQLLLLWTLDSGERRPVLPLSGGGIQSFALGPDGQIVAMVRSGNDDPVLDRAVSIFNLAEERRIFSIALPPRRNFDSSRGPTLALSPDGRHLAMAISRPSEVEIWDLAAREKRHTLQANPQYVVDALEFSPDGSLLMVGAFNFDRAGSLWTVEGGQRLVTVAPAGPASFSADGSHVLMGGGPSAEPFVLLSP